AGDAAGRGADRPRDEPRVRRGPALLRKQYVRVLLREQLATWFGENFQCDLVGHRRRREVDGLVLPEQLGGAALELVDRRVLTLLLVAHLGGGDGGAHTGGGLRRGVRTKVDHASESSESSAANSASV